MKQLYFLIFSILFFNIVGNSQNISLNVQTQNAGLVGIGEEVFVEMQINNLDATENLQTYKIRPRLTVPATVTIAPTGHILPDGFTILTISANQQIITLSNATNELAASTSVSAFIKLIGGPAIAPPQTVQGNLLFSTGVAPGSANGPATPGDNSADNSSTTTVEVVTTTPLTLLNFNMANSNCKPSLSWTTENEVNMKNFKIERSDANLSSWVSVGSVQAIGNSRSGKTKYSFVDNSSMLGTAEKSFYRLKLIDQSERFTLSEIRSFLNNCKTTTVNVFPNPVSNGELHVGVAGTTGINEVRLLSLSGQVVLKSNLTNGSNTLDVKNISNGLYLLDFQNKRVKVIIQN